MRKLFGIVLLLQALAHLTRPVVDFGWGVSSALEGALLATLWSVAIVGYVVAGLHLLGVHALEPVAPDLGRAAVLTSLLIFAAGYTTRRWPGLLVDLAALAVLWPLRTPAPVRTKGSSARSR